MQLIRLIEWRYIDHIIKKNHLPSIHKIFRKACITSRSEQKPHVVHQFSPPSWEAEISMLQVRGHSRLHRKPLSKRKTQTAVLKGNVGESSS